MSLHVNHRTGGRLAPEPGKGGYPFTVKGCHAWRMAHGAWRMGKCAWQKFFLSYLVTNRKYICLSIHFVHYDANQLRECQKKRRALLTARSLV
jgi:hypothetical protein